jgi:hypothetical protein
VAAAAAASAALLGAGCGGGDSCGPTSSTTGLKATAGTASFTYGTLTSGLNNDCPGSNPPAGVVSMTIFGFQVGGAGSITLCVSRPDLLADGSQILGHDAASAQVRIVDLNGDVDACSFTIDRNQPVTGTATAHGMCDNGSDPAGFSITLDGAMTFTRTCGTTVDTVQVTLQGTEAVKTAVAF